MRGRETHHNQNWLCSRVAHNAISDFHVAVSGCGHGAVWIVAGKSDTSLSQKRKNESDTDRAHGALDDMRHSDRVPAISDAEDFLDCVFFARPPEQAHQACKLTQSGQATIAPDRRILQSCPFPDPPPKHQPEHSLWA